MNIKIITRHTPNNYGSLLQSFATIYILENLGHKAQIIDYVRKDDHGLNKVWTEACLKYDTTLKKILYTIIRYPVEKFAEVRFNNMRKCYLTLSPRMHSLKELATLQADIFMTGSDQVWGAMVNGQIDKTYFLSFVQNGKIVSYASSFGKTRFNEDIVSEYKSLLEKYNKITVREDSAVKMLSEWGLTNCIGQVLDPTLLLDKQEWLDYFKLKDQITEDYVLIYQIHNDPNLGHYAKILARNKELRLLRVNPFLHQVIREGRFIICPDIKEFIKIINGAKYIITDSFHGTCFAINFNKQFVEILPNNETITRNQSILTLTGLSSRILYHYSDFSIVDKEIDYQTVNQILSKERKRCIEVINSLLY